MLTVTERWGLTGELIFENALQKLVQGRISLEQALDYIMDFARGDWRLVVDENAAFLVEPLASLNYNVLLIPKGTPDEQIIREYARRGVFVTSDSSDFDLSMVPEPFDEGMIIVANGVDGDRAARKIERTLMNWRKNQPGKPVCLKIDRGDI